MLAELRCSVVDSGRIVHILLLAAGSLSLLPLSLLPFQPDAVYIGRCRNYRGSLGSEFGDALHLGPPKSPLEPVFQTNAPVVTMDFAGYATASNTPHGLIKRSFEAVV